MEGSTIATAQECIQIASEDLRAASEDLRAAGEDLRAASEGRMAAGEGLRAAGEEARPVMDSLALAQSTGLQVTTAEAAAANRHGLKAYEDRAPIKPEFLLKLLPQMEPGSLPLGIATEALSVPEEPSPPAETIATEQLPAPGNDSAIEAALAAEVASKSTELDGGPAAKRSKCAEKKAEKKSSKKRKPLLETNKMCSLIILHGSCRYGDKCKFNHDVPAYLATKGKDIEGDCPFWKKQGGRCHFGVTCRWAETAEKQGPAQGQAAAVDLQSEEVNHLDFKIMNDLRSRRHKFPLTDRFMANRAKDSEPPVAKRPAADADAAIAYEVMAEEGAAKAIAAEEEKIGAAAEAEKKAVDWHHKLYLAPLTTVGNLPFRRICKRFGADITCGEMALSSCLLKGQKSEWALLRRHKDEDVFGVQIAGSNMGTMARCAEVLREVDVDFVDINSGCPIDLIYQQGAGSALMERKNKMRDIVRAMSGVLNVPLTIKMRTGVQDGNPVAHKIIPELRSWGAEMVTIHGRSRKQRYTRLADWDYVIDECAKPIVDIPVFGNGDIMSYEDGLAHLERGIDGLMIARGALMKPWIFTEIKERRHWDISSSERFDILKDYTQCGLEHWGSDMQGVSRTRRFLLEWLSFTYRYIPIGVLERYPQRMNDKPLPYHGRDDMETLMASPNSNDWIRISEMLLGPVEDNFFFNPKHKSNAYTIEEPQG